MALNVKGLILLVYVRYHEGSWTSRIHPSEWILVKIISYKEENAHPYYRWVDNWLQCNSNYRWCVVGNINTKEIKLYVENEEDAVLLKLITWLS